MVALFDIIASSVANKFVPVYLPVVLFIVPNFQSAKRQTNTRCESFRLSPVTFAADDLDQITFFKHRISR